MIVTDSAANSASMEITFAITAGLTITSSSSLPGGNPGDLYSQKFTAAGGSGTGYTWVSDDVPGGLRLSADGELTGSLPAVNTYTFNVTVTDSLDSSASATGPSIAVTNNLGSPLRLR